MDALEESTRKLRLCLQQQVPDLLLQAECGGRLELPDPLPWGYASVPTLYELAELAEEEVQQVQEERQRNEEEARERRERRRREEQQGRERARREAEGEAGGRGRVEGEEPEQEGAVVVGVEADGQQVKGKDRGAAAEGAKGAGGGDVNVEQGAQRGRAEQGALDGQQQPQQEEGERDKQQVQQHGEGHGLEALQAADGMLRAGDGGPGLGRGGMQGAAAAGAAHASPTLPTAAGSTVSRDPVDGGGGNVGDGDGAARDGNGTLLLSSPEGDELQPPPPPAMPYACRAFLDSLAASRTYRSPHCEAAMADVMGMAELYDGLAGTTLAAAPSKEGLEALRAALKEHINARWSLEAVVQGVAHAKQGNYPEAHRCYDKAIELDPGSAEAHVARGAAHANQRSFEAAEADLQMALLLDPGHRNAAAYLEAVQKHLNEKRRQRAVEEEELERERERVLVRRWERRQRHSVEQPALGAAAAHPAGDSRGAEADRAEGGRSGWEQRGPPSAPGRLERGGRRGRGPGSRSGSSSSGGSSSPSSSGSSGSNTPGRDAGAAGGGGLANDAVRKALEVVLKARKSKKSKRSKKSKSKSKSKSSKRKHKRRRKE